MGLIFTVVFSLLFPSCRSERPPPSHPASAGTLIQGASHGGGGFAEKTFSSSHHRFPPPPAAALPLLLLPSLTHGGMLSFGASRVASGIWHSSEQEGEHLPPCISRAAPAPGFAVTPLQLTFPRTALLRLGSAAPPCAVCGVCVCGVGGCVCVCIGCGAVFSLLCSCRGRHGQAGGRRLAGTPSLHVGHRSAWVSGHGKGLGILPELLLVLPSLATAPWASHPIALARSHSRAAPPSPAPPAGSSLPAQAKLPIKLGYFPPCDPF